MRWAITVTALWLILLSTANPVQAPNLCQPSPRLTSAQRPDWIAFTIVCARHYRIRPEFAIGVAFAEGSLGGIPFRFGNVGRYWLPWGIHRYVVKERGWPVWDLYVQTEVAIRALSGHMIRARKAYPGISTSQAEILALHKYNASCNRAYLNRVREGERKFERMVE